MFIVSASFYCFSWLLLLFSSLIFFIFLSIFHFLVSPTVLISFSLSPAPSFFLSFSIISDLYTSLFSSAVSFISLVVFAFSIYYFSSYLKFNYFLWTTFLFVASMLILVNFYDIFFVILGWDGLGVVSFFLILFYQSNVSVFSSILTVLMNRLGDCFFVVLIVIVFYSNFTSYFYYISFDSVSLLVVMCVAFMTNSALYPFSPWLPAAIAAPTPISSLVHSSTLVTAGLFLFIRNFSFLSSFYGALEFLCVLGLFTSFYAGLSSLVEVDLNNVVALSTLSHLGFICFALGLNNVILAYLHLLAHALFNSSLFIALGSLISQHYHYQDSRYFSSLSSSNSFFSFIMVVSSANLLGIPFVSGFYSKDLILESFCYSYYSYFLLFIMYFNLIFTFSYSVRILLSLVTPSFTASLGLSPSSSPFFYICLFMLSFLSVVFGVMFTNLFLHISYYVPFIFKIVPTYLLMVFLFISLVYLSSVFHSSYFFIKSPLSFSSSMIYLSNIWGSILPSSLISFSFYINRVVEYGGLYYFVYSSIYFWGSSLSRAGLYLFKYSSSISFLSLFVFILFCVSFTCLL